MKKYTLAAIEDFLYRLAHDPCWADGTPPCAPAGIAQVSPETAIRLLPPSPAATGPATTEMRWGQKVSTVFVPMFISGEEGLGIYPRGPLETELRRMGLDEEQVALAVKVQAAQPYGDVVAAIARLISPWRMDGDYGKYAEALAESVDRLIATERNEESTCSTSSAE